MSSKKPSAKAKRINEFKAQLSSMDDFFTREEERMKGLSAQREAALRKRSCESKNRYASFDEAQQAIAACAEYGTTGLHSYRCSYCGGWHLTSH